MGTLVPGQCQYVQHWAWIPEIPESNHVTVWNSALPSSESGAIESDDRIQTATPAVEEAAFCPLAFIKEGAISVSLTKSNNYVLAQDD